MVKIETIQMPKEQAKKEWQEYVALLKQRKEKYLKEMKICLYQLKEGKKLIDIQTVMADVSVNKNYKPKIAIARADWITAYFVKEDSGAGFFSNSTNNWNLKKNGGINLKADTFMHWPRIKDKDGKDTWQIANKEMHTKVPIIPAKFQPKGKLSDYYILWEVGTWEEVPPTRDPFLLKRLTENIFVILAAWDITPLEQSILRGL